MKIVFVDSDVMLDYLLMREPFYNDALRLMNAGAIGKTRLLISVITVANLVYFLEKKFDTKTIQQKLSVLRTFINIALSGDKEIDDMMKSPFKDLEDALQHAIALNNKAEILITRNGKDYKHASIPVMDASEFLKSLK